MKSVSITRLLVALALFLPVALAHNLEQELSAQSPAAQPNGPRQPARSAQPVPSQPEVSSPPKISDTHASVTINAVAKSSRSNTPAQTDESVFTLRKTVREVYLVFTVTDHHGHYIKSLKKNDFKILDDGNP